MVLVILLTLFISRLESNPLSSELLLNTTLTRLRYILEEKYLKERPFIWRENAHLDIAFSCVTFLNFCATLLPSNSTECTRAAIIVRGFHGLQAYADKFWYKHVIAYSTSLDEHTHTFSAELLIQLQHLLKFRNIECRSLVQAVGESDEEGAMSQLE
jgi:hypothetical protein